MSDTKNNYERAIERQPSPAFRSAEPRKKAIRSVAAAILRRWPELAEDTHALTVPPPVDEWARDNGYGLYGRDQQRVVRAILTNDIVASEEEISEALSDLRQPSPADCHQSPGDVQSQSIR